MLPRIDIPGEKSGIRQRALDLQEIEIGRQRSALFIILERTVAAKMIEVGHAVVYRVRE